MEELHDLVAHLAREVEGLQPLGRAESPRAEGSARILREDILVTLRYKVLPELRSLAKGSRGTARARTQEVEDGRAETASSASGASRAESVDASARSREGSFARGSGLPIFVGVQGGTNAGKSTIFNALAGHMLSPAVVQASATKHPLVFAHEGWRDVLLDPDLFPELDRRPLLDPKELLVDDAATDRVYFRFHTRNEWKEWAFIDSPDIDSILDSNLESARIVTALSDVVVFVTTGEKYRDRILVEHLRSLLRAKATVVVVFNRLDEEIVFNTLLDDLQSALPHSVPALRALRVPRVVGSIPEEHMSPMLLPAVRRHLEEVATRGEKAALLERTMATLVESLRELHDSYSRELELKERFRAVADEAIATARASYADSFALALPEETLAIRRVLEPTELSTWLRLDPAIERSSRPLAAVAATLGRATRFVRKVLLRVLPQSEGAVEDSPTAIAEYAAARDETDQARASHLALEARQELETFFRTHEGSSALARQVLEEHFTPENAREHLARVRAAHREELDPRRKEAEDILERVDAKLLSRPGRRRAFGMGAIAFKIACGLGLAWMLPPSPGWIAGLIDLLSWLEFAAGYLLAAYILALVVSLALRRRGRFRAARTATMDATLRRAVVHPIATLLDRLLDEEDLRRLESLADKLEQGLGKKS